MFRLLWILPLLPLSALAQPAETLLLAEPAVSKNNIAFVYDNDIWIADRDGAHPRRLTSQKGQETYPAFSPDGHHLIFSGNYDGNTDVYIVPVFGGSPRRLTWHPDDDRALGFTPDGKQVLFTSGRDAFAFRQLPRLFLAPIGGGLPQAMPMPTVNQAAFDRTGRRLAYTPTSEAHLQWKNYRGGRLSRIWIMRPGQDAYVEIPKPEGGCNDTDPMWVDGKVYFTSDRAGEFNLFCYNPKSKKVDQLTQFDEYPVLNASSGDGVIVYEQAGHLRQYDTRTHQDQVIKVAVATDLAERRPRFVSASDWLRNGHLSPDGKRVAVEARGEIITVPADKGEPRNLTNSPGVHDRDPAWSPDGQSIAWFSDASGEYTLHVGDPWGKAVQKIPLKTSGFYHVPRFSPDSKKIALVDSSLTLLVVDVASGSVDKVAQQTQYGPAEAVRQRFDFSPDSRWLAYDLRPDGLISSVYLYNIEEKKSTRITDGLSEVVNPVFDKSGKYLYFFASTDAGPAVDWFAQSSQDMEISYNLYMAVLDKTLTSPLARILDEDAPKDQVEEEKKEDSKAGENAEEVADENRTVIHFDGLEKRIEVLTRQSGFLRQLAAGKAGEVYFLSSNPMTLFEGLGAPGELMKFTLKGRKHKEIAKNVSSFFVSADGAHLLHQTGGQLFLGKPGEFKQVNLKRVKVRVAPMLEWAQMLKEAWRINRDYFYATNYHGVDWDAMYVKYKSFMPHAATKNDAMRIIRWLCSELAVGHSYLYGGEQIDTAERVPIGLLGADFDVKGGRYRITRVYGGLNWNPQMRSPLAAPGVTVNEGDYLLSVNGQDLKVPTNPYSLFEHTAGKAITITVGPHPDGKDSRTYTVTPIADENSLRFRDWVEANIRYVDKMTNGQAGYVFVPNTGTGGHTWFKRYFWPQAHKKAVIIDERWNGGGLLADYYVDHLRRPHMARWTTRHGRVVRSPQNAIQGPKVMIVNEYSSSGGDYLPFMFRKLKLGTIVGKRTWGGLVGILGFPVLMDGTVVTAPDIAIWTEEGGYVVENEGVAPDIDVELEPGAWANGRDAQLEKAIEVVLRQLKENPPKPEPKLPEFPIRNQ